MAGAGRGEALISFKGVKKAFGAKVVYSGLDLEIPRGATVTIMGASGSGKSVMLKMLIGLFEADGGEILFDGQDVTKMHEHELHQVRRRVAYLFQGAALEVLEFGLALTQFVLADDQSEQFLALV